MGPWQGAVADVIEPLNRDYPRVIECGDTTTRRSFLPPSTVLSSSSLLPPLCPLLILFSLSLLVLLLHSRRPFSLSLHGLFWSRSVFSLFFFSFFFVFFYLHRELVPRTYVRKEKLCSFSFIPPPSR